MSDLNELVKLYIVLILTVTLFVAELVFTYLIPSVLLTMNCYHLFCNIIIITTNIYMCKFSQDSVSSNNKTSNETNEVENIIKNKFENTFGWGRLTSLSIVIYFVFIASFSFTVTIECIQILANYDTDKIPNIFIIFLFGAASLLLSCLTIILNGGCFFKIFDDNNITLNKAIVPDLANDVESNTNICSGRIFKCYNLLKNIFIDTFGSILMVAGPILMYYMPNKQFELIWDPLLTFLYIAMILKSTYFKMKTHFLILMQNMPDSMNPQMITNGLLKQFPDIIHVHEFHIWQISANHLISTIHIIFKSRKDYFKILENIKQYFQLNGIMNIFIQPEFRKNDQEKLSCLMKCPLICKPQNCCINEDAKELKGKKSDENNIEMGIQN